MSLDSPRNIEAAEKLARMALRDSFAAAALTGLMSSEFSALPYGDIAEMAYKQADAMIKARQS